MAALDRGSIPEFERSWLYRHRGAIGRFLLIPAGLLAILTPAPFVEGSVADAAFDAVGWILLLLGGGLRLWATLYIGGRKSGAIVSDGPYSICRNPLYVGSFLMALSGGFFLQSAAFLAAAVAMAFLYASGTVRNEEVFMHCHFGQQYLDYMARTPRYFPRFSAFKTEPVIPVDLHALWKECHRAAVWLLVPILAEGVAILRSQPWWHLLF